MYAITHADAWARFDTLFCSVPLMLTRVLLTHEVPPGQGPLSASWYPVNAAHLLTTATRTPSPAY